MANYVGFFLPKEQIDMNEKINQLVSEEINWEKVSVVAKQRQPGGYPISIMDIFTLSICNRNDCPWNWPACRGKNKTSCHYYDIMRARLNR